MEFTLVYQGPLKANGRVKEKQCLRRIFHRQLKQLWETSTPLKSGNHFLDDNPPKGNTSIIQKVGKFRFAPLVTQRLHLFAELSITMLRSEPAGGIITSQGGDIDNRLKTLLDSLRMPKNESEIPKDDSPKGKDEDPFFCLLEDDKLITKISVNTDQLLEPTDTPTFVNLVIHVKIKAIALTWENMALA